MTEIVNIIASKT